MQAQRMRIIKTAKWQMESIVEETRTRDSLRKRSPAAASILYAPGDLMRVYRESYKIMSGRFLILRVNCQDLYVNKVER